MAFPGTGSTVLRVVGTTVVPAAALYAAYLSWTDDWDRWDAFVRPHREVPPDLRPRVVVLGSGWGALSVLDKLHSQEFNVTLVSPRNHFLYTPLLTGATVGSTEPRSILEPVRSVCHRTKSHTVQYLHAEALAVDLSHQSVKCKDASESVGGAVKEFDLHYDYLVVAVGSQSSTFGIPGVEEHAFFLKEIHDANAIRAHLSDCLEAASLPGQPLDVIKRLLHVVVVGGGPSGIEFAAELHDFLAQDLKRAFPKVADHLRITVVEALPTVLPMFPKGLIEYTEKQFARSHVQLLTSAQVSDVGPSGVTVKTAAGPELMPYGTLVWVAGNTMRPLVVDMKRQLGHTGRRGLEVGTHLLVKGTTNVFAVGDCADSGLPWTAQVAAQQGKYLGRLFNQASQDMSMNTSRAVVVRGSDASVDTSKLMRVDSEYWQRYAAFMYRPFGSFAYVGGDKAVVSVIPDPSNPDSQINTSGFTAFVLWRSVYFSKLLSARNRLLVAVDWAKTRIFGRDLSRE